VSALVTAAATGQMRKVNYGRFLVRYEDDGVEEWPGLPGDAFNNDARGSWRVDLDFEASGGVEGSGGKVGFLCAAVPSAAATTTTASHCCTPKG